MKITDEQNKAALKVYLEHPGGHLPSFRAAIESLPEPLPRLRPLSEMPPEVPEGAVRLYGREFDDREWSLDQHHHQDSDDTHFLDVLPPLPEPAKPDSLQEELVTALEAALAYPMTGDWHEQARKAIAKAKGAPQP